jgi:hypothetical protein
MLVVQKQERLIPCDQRQHQTRSSSAALSDAAPSLAASRAEIGEWAMLGKVRPAIGSSQVLLGFCCTSVSTCSNCCGNPSRCCCSI